MTLTHIPFLVSLVCSHAACDNMVVIQDMIRSNLGPLLYSEDYIVCTLLPPTYRKTQQDSHAGPIECDIYAPWKTSCKCCKQLKDTFTPEAASHVLNGEVYSTKVTCEFVERYRGCTF